LKHRFAILVGVALVLVSTAGQARPVSSSEILSIVRSAGFRPVGTAGRDGENYVVRAIDRYGDDVQVIVDAEDADILYVRRLRGLARDGFAGPRVVQGPRYPDFYGNVPRPPRVVPGTRVAPPATRAAAAGPPVPRPRPDDVTGSVKTEPAAPALPAAASPAAPAKTAVPPVVGFE
jgi:hypothetical protein